MSSNIKYQVQEEGDPEVLVPGALYRMDVDLADRVECVSLHTIAPRRKSKPTRMIPRSPQAIPGCLHAPTQFPHRILFENLHQLENNHLQEKLLLMRISVSHKLKKMQGRMDGLEPEQRTDEAAATVFREVLGHRPAIDLNMHRDSER
ncbi:hypothetical protein CKAN_01734500 [Cinnamomum micranthum f. kanehirae]|uniref:Uncharacterized protein n=1 Tax=Cinnamomum micranthum f. kanehirae TaxID=337451 RepID=A0A443PC61_9MAGN|nr:hypothetical protein CKAN_01734500 [Cinnamomum micranthum f. kanehirae]